MALFEIYLKPLSIDSVFTLVYFLSLSVNVNATWTSNLKHRDPARDVTSAWSKLPLHFCHAQVHQKCTGKLMCADITAQLVLARATMHGY